MAKFSLASAPKTFKRKVTITLLDDTTAEIEITFKYKSRSEYAKLLDDVNKREETNTNTYRNIESKPESMVDKFKRFGTGTTDFLMKIIEAWDLEDTFNKANVTDLIDRFPASAHEIAEAYRIAILEGRTKN